MNEQIKDLLGKEIVAELNSLEELEYGSEGHKLAVDGLVKLYGQYIEADKIEKEFADKREAREKELADKREAREKELADKREAREKENEIKRKQLFNELLDFAIKHGVTFTGTVLGLSVTIWGVLRTIEFEEKGTVTTIVGRGLFNRLLPK